MMTTVASHTILRQIKRATVRGVFIASLAVCLASTFLVMQEPTAVYAAPVSSTTTVRQDRRPDRERPVATSQGSGSGFSQGSPSTQVRPRLVRR